MAKHITILDKPRSLTGFRRDFRDLRDVKHEYPHQKGRFSFLRAPVSYDPRKTNAKRALPRVEDQSVIGSCVGHAWSSACEYRLKRQLLLKDRNADPSTIPELSRLFVYYAGRVWVEGWDAADDSGMFIRSGAKALAQYGTCVETLWPYDVGQMATEPTGDAQKDALKHQIISYHQITSLNGILHALAQGLPVIGGFAVPASIDDEDTFRTGILKMPDSRGTVGGHAVWFCGYDRKKKMLLAQNSWSEAWGDGGYLHMPFQYWPEGLLTDCWTLMTLEDGKE